MIYIFDIDGTLANLEHRLHFIQQKPADWDGFFAACPDDQPIYEVIRTAQALKEAGAAIVMLSGRSEAVRFQTLDWFKKFEVPCDCLYMREEGDHREDSIVKAEQYDHMITKWPIAEIVAVFEDRQQVVDMFRARGLRVFQVAPGNF